MSKYTVLYGHLEKEPDLNVGQLVQRGTAIAEMGNSGKSTGPHLHIGIIYGLKSKVFLMADIEIDEELVEQLNYFIDDELFNCPIKITTYFCDPRYKDPTDKWVYHPGYDVVPREHGQNTIYWNRSHSGLVLAKGSGHAGYGNYLLVGYEDGST